MTHPIPKYAIVRTDMLHALPEHHLVEDLAARHAHKAVVHLRLPEWLQRLYIPTPRLIGAIEGRAGDRTLRRLRGLRFSLRRIRHIASRLC